MVHFLHTTPPLPALLAETRRAPEEAGVTTLAGVEGARTRDTLEPRRVAVDRLHRAVDPARDRTVVRLPTAA